MNHTTLRLALLFIMCSFFLHGLPSDVHASARSKGLKELGEDTADALGKFVRRKGDDLAKAGEQAKRVDRFKQVAKLDPSEAKLLDRFRAVQPNGALSQLDDVALAVAKQDPKVATRILESAPADGSRILKELDADGLGALKSLDSADEYSKTMVVVFRGVDDLKAGRSVDVSIIKQLDEVNHSRGVLNFAMEYGKDGLKWVGRNWKWLAIAGGIALIWAKPELLMEFIENTQQVITKVGEETGEAVGGAVGGGLDAFFRRLFFVSDGGYNWSSVAFVIAVVLASLALLWLKLRSQRTTIEVVAQPTDTKSKSRSKTATEGK